MQFFCPVFKWLVDMLVEEVLLSRDLAEVGAALRLLFTVPAVSPTLSHTAKAPGMDLTDYATDERGRNLLHCVRFPVMVAVVTDLVTS